VDCARFYVLEQPLRRSLESFRGFSCTLERFQLSRGRNPSALRPNQSDCQLFLRRVVQFKQQDGFSVAGLV
jgi:hypothetical protein